MATGRAEGEVTASEIGISPAVVVETGMPSAAVPGDTTDPRLAPAAIAAPRAWDLEAGVEGAEEAEVEGVEGAGKPRGSCKRQ